MKFAPKSAKDIAMENLLPPGIYDFEILEAVDAVSDAGNDMIKMRVKVYGVNGTERIVTDFLLEKMARKLRHAAEACGLIVNYEAGSLDADDFAGKVGKAKIVVEKSRDPNFADKNKIADYIVNYDGSGRNGESKIGEGGQRRAAPASLDDDIPF